VLFRIRSTRSERARNIMVVESVTQKFTPAFWGIMIIRTVDIRLHKTRASVICMNLLLFIYEQKDLMTRFWKRQIVNTSNYKEKRGIMLFFGGW